MSVRSSDNPVTGNNIFFSPHPDSGAGDVLLAVFNGLADPVMLLDASYAVIGVNQAAVEFYGYSASEFLGLTAYQIAAPEHAPFIADRLEKVFQYGVSSFKSTHLTKQGVVIPVEIHARSIPLGGSAVLLASIRDISERLHADNLLRETEYFLQESQRAGNIGSYAFDFSTNCWVASAVLDELFGISSAYPHTTEGWLQLVHPADRAEMYAYFTGPAMQQRRFDKDYRIVRVHDGAVRWMYGRGVISNDNHGQPATMIGTIQDITSRKEAEELLRASELRYKSLFELESDALFIIRKSDGRILDANNAACRMYGFTREELLELSSNVFSPQGIRGAGEERESVRRRTHKRKDGSLFPVEITATYLTLNGEEVVMPAVRDITEREAQYEALLSSEQRFRSLFEHSSVPQWEEDFTEVKAELDRLAGSGIPNLREYLSKNPSEVIRLFSLIQVTDVNRAVVRLHKAQSKDELLGNLTVLSNSEHLPVMTEELALIAEGKTRFRLESSVQSLDYETMHVILRWRMISPPDDYSRIILSVEDITEIKRAALEMQRAKEHAEELNRLKSSFLANMSHELRTPMIGILGYTEILADETQDRESTRMLNIINKSAHRLLETLNQILDLARIESENTDIDITACNPVPILQEAATLFRPAAERKGLRITEEYPLAPVSVRADERLLRQSVINLLNNAVKFTPSGTVLIRVESVASPTGAPLIAVCIKDTGIGIPDEKLNIIWDEFRQVSEGKDRIFEGTGLGLTITRRFIEMIGGSISVHSIPGEGTTFTLLLPQAIPMLPQQAFTQPAEAQGLPRILYFENDHLAVDLVRRILKGICEVEHAENAPAGLAAAKVEHYPLVLMDINLTHEMSGIEATRTLRNMAGYETTPIVAVTAYALPGDRHEILAAGCSHYLSKPFNIKNFRDLISSLL